MVQGGVSLDSSENSTQQGINDQRLSRNTKWHCVDDHNGYVCIVESVYLNDKLVICHGHSNNHKLAINILVALEEREKGGVKNWGWGGGREKRDKEKERERERKKAKNLGWKKW